MFDRLAALPLGRHPLAAFKKLKLKTIPAMVEDEDSPAVERWAKRMEISENLFRRNLSDATRASLLAQLKALYEEEHPEAKPGGNQHTKRRSQVGIGTKPADAFVDDTAKKTGRSRTAVARDV